MCITESLCCTAEISTLSISYTSIKKMEKKTSCGVGDIRREPSLHYTWHHSVIHSLFHSFIHLSNSHWVKFTSVWTCGTFIWAGLKLKSKCVLDLWGICEQEIICFTKGFAIWFLHVRNLLGEFGCPVCLHTMLQFTNDFPECSRGFHNSSASGKGKGHGLHFTGGRRTFHWNVKCCAQPWK